MKKPVYYVLLICAVHLILDIFFLTYDTVPQGWDQSSHLYYSLIYFDLFKDGRIADALLSSSFYPPLYYIVTLPIYLASTALPYPIYINFIFLIITAFSIYGLASDYFDKKTGVWATLIILSYPSLVIQRRYYLLDFPLTAMVAASMYAFHKSRGLTKTWPTIFAAIATSLCLLTKEFGLIFLLPFYVFSMIHTEHTVGKIKMRVGNSIVFIIIIVSLCWIWYVPNIPNILQGFSDLSMYAGLEKDPTGISLRSISYYLFSLHWRLSPIMTAALVCSLFALVVGKRKDNTYKILLPTLIVVYLILMFIPNKDYRYDMPLMIIFALITSGGLYSVSRHKLIHNVLSVLLVIMCTLQTLSHTIGWPYINSRFYTYAHTPKKEDWHIVDVVQFLPSRSKNAMPNVLILSDHPRINSSTFRYYSARTSGLFRVNFPIIMHTQGTIDSMIRDAEFIVYKTQYELMYDKTPKYELHQKAYSIFEGYRTEFSLIKLYDLPDGSNLQIYERNLPHGLKSSSEAL